MGNFLLPLMLGAKDVAFPRLNLLSYWVYTLQARCFFLYTLFMTGGLDTGWTFYTPYSTKTGHSGHLGHGWAPSSWGSRRS